ncbi:MAG TPA: type II secretion system protein [Vicinamibacterales bacterium]|jgi:general secretion pathway protein G|nr:type II secretion system protein [Vicinamibacterales bacterium]
MNEQQVTPERSSRASGFTLMEMMIVMVLIVILAGIGLSVYGNSVQRAKEATLKEDLFRMRDAIDQYYADKNKYPGSLEDLVSEKYLRAVPVDPFTQKTDSWQTTTSEPDPGNPSLESGISNVKSGSEQTGLDGSRYADW